MQQIRHYIDVNGRDYITEWLRQMRDIKARIAIDKRIMRLELGNFGDHKPLREGVWELRIDVGAGYRLYYAQDGLTLVLLICGGDKRRQNADIDRACAYWHEWQQRKREGKP